MTAKYDIGDRTTQLHLENLLKGYALMAWQAEYIQEYHTLVSRTKTEAHATNFIVVTIQSPVFARRGDARGTKAEVAHLNNRGVVLNWSEQILFRVQVAVPYVSGCRCHAIVEGYEPTIHAEVTRLLRNELASLPDPLPGESTLKGNVNGNAAIIRESICMFCV